MKVRSSVKRICENCKLIRRHGKVRVICSDPRFPAMMDRDLSKTTLESFLLSIASLRRTDLRPMFDQIKVPALGIYGDRDKVVHPKQWQPMQAGISQVHIERFPIAGHFPMLEEPQKFSEKLKAFLDKDYDAVAAQPQTSSPSSPVPATSVTLAP